MKWRDVKGLVLLCIIVVLVQSIFQSLHVYSEASISPSKDWGIFLDTRGPIKIDITEPGVAVRLEIPREFMGGRVENDTSYIFSDISDDYYYYRVDAQEIHYPYDQNAPYTIEVWHPPVYSILGCMKTWINFTPPRYIILEDLEAPDIVGIYNVTVYIAPNMREDGTPNFPSEPNQILKIPVSMREDPGCITGYIADKYTGEIVTTKGVVYAYHESGPIARAYVNATTGFFNLTGLYQGQYTLIASAGYYSPTGFAYAQTTLTSVTVNKGSCIHIGYFRLNRGCRINGSITYTDKYNNPIEPLKTPYLKALNFQTLNYTLEVYDEDERIVASQTYPSKNQPVEDFSLIIRNGTRYTGYTALGTEYSGFGPGIYTIKAWVYGFTLLNDITVTILDYGDKRTVNLYLTYGSVVSGTIILTNSNTGETETPREAELSALGTQQGDMFGGHILAELYDEYGVRKGLTLLDGTFQNGTTHYADEYSIRFWILGFSEFHNRSYSGFWMIGSHPGPSPWDYGIEAGNYYIKVWIRGYVQREIPIVILSEWGNSSVTVYLERGGTIDATVYTYIVKPGTRAIQSPTPWRFIDLLCPQPYLRLYIYDESGEEEIGYVERQIKLGESGVFEMGVHLNFTGHNWPLSKIIKYGNRIIYNGDVSRNSRYRYLPSAIDEGNYLIKGYTYGYVQTVDFETYVYLSGTSSIAFALIIGNGIHGGVPLMADDLFTSLTENVTIRAQALLNELKKGVDVVNATKGDFTFSYNILGFYGRGHFFYVDPTGFRWKDNGLDVGNYSVYIPEFGFDRHFLQEIDLTVDLPELMIEKGVYFPVHRMIKIFGNIRGFDETRIIDRIRLLSWVSVSAPQATYPSNGYYSVNFPYSIDGIYAIHLPRDISYVVTFYEPGYLEDTVLLSTNDQVEYSPVLEESGEPFP